MPLGAIFILLRTSVSINEKEIIFKKFAKEKSFLWEDIISIERIRRYSLTPNPKDLKISIRNGKEIYIYGYLKDLNDAEQRIEKYSMKTIGEKTVYKGNGSIIYKRYTDLLWLLIGINFGSILVLYYYYQINVRTVVVYLSPTLFLLLIYYFSYFERMTQVVISFNENEMLYESSRRYGIFFKRVKFNFPWKAIISAKIVDEKKGPIIIETTQGDYPFWSNYDNDINVIVADKINLRCK